MGELFFLFADQRALKEARLTGRIGSHVSVKSNALTYPDLLTYLTFLGPLKVLRLIRAQMPSLGLITYHKQLVTDQAALT